MQTSELCFCRYRMKQFCLAGLAMLLFVGGCSRTQPSRLYVLTPVAVPAAQQAGVATHSLALGLGPVELPQYVERPQILTRTGPNAFDLAEFDRQTARFREQAETNDHQASVSTMSRAVEKLSTDIAAAVRTLP